MKCEPFPFHLMLDAQVVFQFACIKLAVCSRFPVFAFSRVTASCCIFVPSSRFSTCFYDFSKYTFFYPVPRLLPFSFDFLYESRFVSHLAICILLYTLAIPSNAILAVLCTYFFFSLDALSFVVLSLRLKAVLARWRFRLLIFSIIISIFSFQLSH